MLILQVASIKTAFNDNLRIGGPETSVIGLSKALSKKYNVSIYNLLDEDKIHIKGIKFFSKMNIFNPSITMGRPNLVLIHEVYNLKIIPIIHFCKKNNIKVFIFPRGALSEIARKINSLKKFFFFKFIFSHLVKNIDGLIALNKGEKKEIASLYPKSKIKIVPNGSNIFFKKNELLSYKKKNIKKLIIGYLGRYDFYIKGLDVLINEYQAYINQSSKKKISLVFIGEHRNRMNFCSKTIIKNFNIKNPKKKIIVKGPFYGKKKYKELLKFDALVLPSRSEGMPNVILEAMSLGIPVVVTPQTNMSKIVKVSDCGWIINHKKNNIKDFFIKFENIKKIVSQKKGINGYNFIQKKLKWDF